MFLRERENRIFHADWVLSKRSISIKVYFDTRFHKIVMHEEGRKSPRSHTICIFHNRDTKICIVSFFNVLAFTGKLSTSVVHIRISNSAHFGVQERCAGIY